MDEEIKKKIDDFKERHEDVLKKISVLRKKGYDMTVISLRIMNIPSKIRMMEVSEDIADIKKGHRLLDMIIDEIYNVEREGVPEEFRSEKSTTEMVDEIKAVVMKTNTFLDVGDFERAKLHFADVTNLYKSLPAEHKPSVYHDCMKVIERMRSVRTE